MQPKFLLATFFILIASATAKPSSDAMEEGLKLIRKNLPMDKIQIFEGPLVSYLANKEVEHSRGAVYFYPKEKKFRFDSIGKNQDFTFLVDNQKVLLREGKAKVQEKEISPKTFFILLSQLVDTLIQPNLISATILKMAFDWQLEYKFEEHSLRLIPITQGLLISRLNLAFDEKQKFKSIELMHDKNNQGFVFESQMAEELPASRVAEIFNFSYKAKFKIDPKALGTDQSWKN